MPVVNALTIPVVAPTDTTNGHASLHVPPATISDKVITLPGHMLKLPPIAPGPAFTVTTCVTVIPLTV